MRADEILIVEGSKKFEAEVSRKPSGAIIIEGMHVCDTMTCVHCNHVWIPVKGSGITRGWCMNCNAPTCGAHECYTCYPFLQKLTDYEKGKLKVLR